MPQENATFLEWYQANQNIFHKKSWHIIASRMKICETCLDPLKKKKKVKKPHRHDRQ